MATSDGANSRSRLHLLLLYSALLVVGNCGGPLIMRSYFINGGKRVWLSAFLQTAGFPLLLFPIGVSCYTRRRDSGSADTIASSSIFRKPRILAASVATGALAATGNFLYSAGIGLLPVSTSSLIYATQLGFTAAFAFLLLGQRFTVYSINAVVLLTAGAVLLGMNSSAESGGDRPEGEAVGGYAVGFVVTAVSAAVTGFVLPFVEFAYARGSEGRSVITNDLVMEFQFVTSAVATLICAIGMLLNRDFEVISKEAKEFALGETKYYVVLICSSIFLQCFFLGCNGVVSCSSSLLSGILIAVSLPITELFSVVFYHEKFPPEKGLALFLCLWGFVSYFSGEIEQISKKETSNELRAQLLDDEHSTSVNYSILLHDSDQRA